MLRFVSGGIYIALFAYGVANAALPPPVLPPPVTVPRLEAGLSPPKMTLSRAVFKLKEGQVWASWGAIYTCALMPTEVRWKADESEVDTKRFNAVFEEETEKAGFARSASDSLFDTDSAGDSLQIGVIIKDMRAQICSLSSDTGPRVFRGSLLMTAEWQVYDPLKREVVARVETVAGGEEKKSEADGVERVILAAFRESTRALLADERFRQNVLSPRGAAPNAAAAIANSTPIMLVQPAVSAKRSIPDASGSVVAIFTDTGHGSGFLVSSDGYLITNQHVVGGSKYVKIRWSDGFETVGEVIRSDKRRDVALVKTDPHGRSPLSLRRGGVQSAETVFALGTPLDPKFQGTVTKGVVSSTRILEGFSFIQSDVTINPGNSGGPLLDEQGAVVGIAVSVYRANDAPTGINLFIPIGDALDFLNLKPGV